MAMICTGISLLKDSLAIERYEDKYAFDLPKELKCFFQENNGGIPKKKVFTARGGEYEIRCFLSFNRGEYNSIDLPIQSFQEETKGKIVPIAKDSGDNYYCINVETGKIYYWDKDDNLYYCIAEDFGELVEYLQ